MVSFKDGSITVDGELDEKNHRKMNICAIRTIPNFNNVSPYMTRVFFSMVKSREC